MSVVRLEGFHALKHALRFGAEIIEAGGDLGDLPESHAPDVAERMRALTTPGGDVVAIARRPEVDVAALLAAPGPIVLLENPRHLGNLGACVRVAAAAGAAGVLTTGDRDPWSPDALRGSAGLHFALTVARVVDLPAGGDRPLVAIDPEGDEHAPIPARALLAFGTERHGLSPALLARADARVRIPMRPGVSSLNLATAVAAVLYGGRLREGREA